MKKFDELVKDAKVKKLQYRIVRDVVFIVLGIFFLILSILTAQKAEDKKVKDNKNKTVITTTIKKTK